MRHFLTLLFSAFLVLAQAQTDHPTLSRIFSSIDSLEEKLVNPIQQGKHPETFTWLTVDQLKQRNHSFRRWLDQMNAIPLESLTRSDQISRTVMELKLRDALTEEEYQTYLMPYNAEGGFFNRATFFLPRLPFEDAADYRAYLKWLPSYVDYLKAHQKRLQMGMEAGITGPQVVVRNLIQLMTPYLSAEWRKHPFGTPFNDRPEAIVATEWASLLVEGEAIVAQQLLPAYQALAQFIESDYLPACPEKVGISEIPEGKEYYANRVRHYTTLNISPDSVFNLGLSEVARIDQQMRVVMGEVGFTGSFDEFLTFLRTDPQFYAKTGPELLRRAAWLSKKAEAQLPRYFRRLYSLPFTVAPVPAAIAPTYTAGRYVGGSWEAQRPGTYWVNTYDLPSRTLYTLPALTLHESVPGHHLQNALAAESDLEVPAFRKSYYISAFGEGWGLYTEFLGEEMGMYETPYELFGRYTYEMWRACRLVVDVGIHAKEWTRQEAVNFMAEHTALSMREINSEIDRYIGWPGQALSYKVGEITIKRLRKQAEDALGDRFDIREFHYHLLKNGSVPLPELVQEIEKYVFELSTKDQSIVPR